MPEVEGLRVLVDIAGVPGCHGAKLSSRWMTPSGLVKCRPGPIGVLRCCRGGSSETRMLRRIEKPIIFALFICLTVGFSFAVSRSSRYKPAQTYAAQKGGQTNDAHKEWAVVGNWVTNGATGFFTLCLVIVGSGQVGLSVWQLRLIKRSS